MKRTGLILLASLVYVNGHSQTKRTTSVQQIWTGYFNQTRLTNRWSLWFNTQLRSKDRFTNDVSLFTLRPAVAFHATENIKLIAGYAYTWHYPHNNSAVRPEHRFLQQFQWHTQQGNKKSTQYIRLEERFHKKLGKDSTAKGYNFNYRIRYSYTWQVPISLKQNSLKSNFSFLLNNEVFISFGKEIVYNYFDQNRFSAALAYHVNKQNQIQIGYLNLFQQLSAGNQYRVTHAIRALFTHHLDLRKTSSL
jgi:hypothetical protein